MFPLIGQQSVGKRSNCSFSNFSIKIPKLALSSTELLYKHLQTSCGAKEIIEITKNGFFKGLINGEHVRIDVQIDTFFDVYTKYMKQMKSLDSHGYEIVKNAVLARTLVAEDELSIKDISYLLGLSNSTAGRLRQVYGCRGIESDTPIHPQSEDVGALCTSFHHMYLKDIENPAAGIGFYEGIQTDIPSKNHRYIGVLDSCLLDNLVKTSIIDELNNIFIDIDSSRGITQGSKFSSVETTSSIKTVLETCTLAILPPIINVVNEQELTTFLIGSNISSVHVSKKVFMEDVVSTKKMNVREERERERLIQARERQRENEERKRDRVREAEKLRFDKIELIKKRDQEVKESREKLVMKAKEAIRKRSDQK